MLEFSKYAKTQDDIDFINEIITALDNLNEVVLSFGDESFSVEPTNGQIWVFVDADTPPQIFADFAGFCLGFMLDGKPFIEQISQVDFG